MGLLLEDAYMKDTVAYTFAPNSAFMHENTHGGLRPATRSNTLVVSGPHPPDTPACNMLIIIPYFSRGFPICRRQFVVYYNKFVLPALCQVLLQFPAPLVIPSAPL